MEPRDISCSEMAALCELFENEERERKIEFPCDETREEALLDFIYQYQCGNENPHIDICF